MSTAKIGMGGGCHWCTEAVFAALTGVNQIAQGFISSDAPDDGFSEAVIATFDAQVIPLEVLIEIHLRTHSSMSSHSLRGKYRSAIYTYSDAQAAQVKGSIERLQPEFPEPIITRVLPFGGFRASDERFQDYHLKHAGGPFCRRYIDPKLDRLRRDFTKFLNQG